MAIPSLRRFLARYQRMFYVLALVVFAVGTLVPVVSASKPKAITGPFNYAEALQKSIYFYDAEKSGPGVTGGLLEWRGDSELSDVAVPLKPMAADHTGTNMSQAFINANRSVLDPNNDGTMDLSGGWHDAGDHVKFGLPQGYAASTLGWGYYEFKADFIASGQQKHLLDQLKWVADYMLRATFRNSSGAVVAFAYQVGEGSIDHTVWNSSELKGDARPAYFATSETPASDQAAEAAATLAVISLDYSSVDAVYAAKCLDTAKALYAFAKANRGLGYSGGFYDSSFDEDELTWAATWLYTATNDQQYITDIGGPDPVTGVYTGYLSRVIKSSQDNWQNIWVHSWDTVWGGAFMRLTTLFPSNTLYDYIARWNIEYWSGSSNSLPHQNTTDTTYLAYTPGGFGVISTWGSARYNAAAQLCALVYAKNKNRPDFAAWAKSQMDYIMGNNPMGYSYIVGFPSTAQSAQHPHHRDAHGSTTNSMFDPPTHKHVLWGALVGGPDKADLHKDLTNDFVYNEVAIDYNAGLVGALAGLYHFYGAGQVPLANFPPLEPTETAYSNEGKIEQETNQRTQYSVRLTAIPSHPPHYVTGLKARYFFNISELIAAGQTISAVSVAVYYDEQASAYGGSTVVSNPIAWDAANGIYYVEMDWSANALYGKRDLQVGLVAAQAADYASHWDPSNDWSHQALTSTALASTQYIPIYLDGVKVWGLEPGGTPANTPTNTVAVNTNTPVSGASPTRTATAVAVTLTPTSGASSTRTLTPGPTNTPTRTFTIVARTNTPTTPPGPATNTRTPTRTNTPTIGASPSRTSSPTLSMTPRPITATPTRTLTPATGTCSPVTSTITAPFAFDGAGTFCWQANTLATYINSWNTSSVTVNGANYTNLYTAVSSFPAKINGYWYIGYTSAVAWGHFEAK